MRQTDETNMLSRVLVENPCYVIFLSEAASWTCHKKLFDDAGLMALWSEQTDGEFCCLVRGNKETGTSIHILEKSPPGSEVKFCIFTKYFGEKRPATERDNAARASSFMPKGRKEGYRKDCESRPEVFRAGLEKFTACVFVVTHGVMQHGPMQVLKRRGLMMDAVIRRQCDFITGDGNQATSTIISGQDEADIHNSMLSTVARATLGAYNENKWMHERVGFSFFDNNPFEVTEHPTRTARLDLDCCWFAVLCWGHSAYDHHSRCYARGVSSMRDVAAQQGIPFDIKKHQGDVDQDSFCDLGVLG